MFQFEDEKSVVIHFPIQNYKHKVRFFLMEVPGVGETPLLNMFINNSRTYNNVTWCLNEPWKKSPVLDHVCEQRPSEIRNTVQQVKTTFGDGKCGGIRMMWDYSLVDKVLEFSRRQFLLITVLRHPVYRLVDAYLGSSARNVTTLTKSAESEALKFQGYGNRNHQVRQLVWYAPARSTIGLTGITFCRI